MYFEITPMRVRGRPLSQKELRSAKSIRGDVHLRLEPNTLLGRPSPIAYLHNVPFNEKQDVLLYDAVVTTLASGGGTITGIELIDGVAYAQSWWVRAIERV